MKNPNMISIRVPDPDNPGQFRRIQLSPEQLLALESGPRAAGTRFGLPPSPLFRDVPDVALVELGRIGRRRSLGQGSTIVKEGETADSVFLVLSGRVKSTAEDSSGRVWAFFDLSHYSAGDLVGESALVGDEYTSTLTATTECSVLQVRRDEWNALLLAHSQLAVNLATYMTERVVRSGQRFVQFSGSFTAARVAMVLLYQAQSDGIPTSSPGKVRISSPITHEEISSQVGTTRESVVAAMKKLGSAVERAGRFYTVDVPRLKKFVDGDAD